MINRGEKQCYKAARYFGQEAECNRLPIADYQEDIAGRYGKIYTWDTLPMSVKQAAIKEFRAGQKEERDA